MPSVNEQLRSEAVKHSIYLQRYSTNTARKILKLLANTDFDILQQIQRLDDKVFTSPLTLERINSLLNSIRAINKDIYNQLYNALQADLKQLSGHEVEYQVGTI